MTILTIVGLSFLAIQGLIFCGAAGLGFARHPDKKDRYAIVFMAAAVVAFCAAFAAGVLS